MNLTRLKIQRAIVDVVRDHPTVPLVMIVARAAEALIREDGRITPEIALEMVSWEILGMIREWGYSSFGQYGG